MKKLIIVTNDNNGSARIKKDVYKHIKNFEVHFVSIKAKISPLTPYVPMFGYFNGPEVNRVLYSFHQIVKE